MEYETEISRAHYIGLFLRATTVEWNHAQETGIIALLLESLKNVFKINVLKSFCPCQNLGLCSKD